MEEATEKVAEAKISVHRITQTLRVAAHIYITGRTKDVTTFPVTALTNHTDTKTVPLKRIARVDQMFFAILQNDGGRRKDR